MTSIKDHIQGTATFVYYRDSALWYRTSETDLLFPVPISDTVGATFAATDKGLFFMRWIRRYLDSLVDWLFLFEEP